MPIFSNLNTFVKMMTKTLLMRELNREDKVIELIELIEDFKIPFYCCC
jgi:hypothetical protein